MPIKHMDTPRDPDAPLDMLVVPSGLSGMSALWNVALEAEDPVVVGQATKLLNRTHQVSAHYFVSCCPISQPAKLCFGHGCETLSRLSFFVDDRGVHFLVSRLLCSSFRFPFPLCYLGSSRS